jgi:signal transduction histidine kinase
MMHSVRSVAYPGSPGSSAVKSNKAGALESMQKGEGGAVDRDLYVFCANASDGAFTVHPTLMGKNLRDVKDKNGKALGEEMLKVAKEGTYETVTYHWPRPEETCRSC